MSLNGNVDPLGLASVNRLVGTPGYRMNLCGHLNTIRLHSCIPKVLGNMCVFVHT